MKEQDNIDILGDGLLNEKDQQDAATLAQWEKEHPENRKFYDFLMRIKMPDNIAEYAESLRESILTELNAKIDRSTFVVRFFRVTAAAAVILMMIGTFSYLSYNAGYHRQSSQLVKLENPLGTKTSLTLPDGSKVTLNAGSTLSYPTVFTGKERKVSIEGEGYFEVQHDANHPFIVKANDVYVKVLGTKFNVKAYNDESNIDVTLSEGRVQVSLENGISAVQMIPMDQVIFDKFKRTFTKRNIDVKSYIGWKDNRLYFNNETFGTIARQLERKFNVHIHIQSDRLRNTVFTGDFVRGENLDEILKVMTYDERISCKWDGDHIYISEIK